MSLAHTEITAAASRAVDGANMGHAPTILEVQGGQPLVIPGEGFLLTAAFGRSGSDLVLTGMDGETVIVRGYFESERPADLRTAEGQLIRGDLAEHLAGPLAPGQFAQASGSADAPVGKVTAATGEVTATHVDGTKVALAVDGPIYQGDVLETGSGGAVNVLFADGTTFALGESARLVIDEFVYNPGGGGNAASFALVQGLFVFVSGEVAHQDADAMTLSTPVATIGIRGTGLGIQAAAEGLRNLISLLVDPGGELGSVTVANDGGTTVLDEVNETTALTSYDAPPSQTFILSENQVERLYQAPLVLSPFKGGLAPIGGTTEGTEGTEAAAEEGDHSDDEATNVTDTDELAGPDIAFVSGLAGGNPLLDGLKGLFTNPLEAGLEPLDPDISSDREDEEIVFAEAGAGDEGRNGIGSDQLDDNLVGIQGQANLLVGRAGNDTITGGDFVDFMFGNAGNDTIVGGSGLGNDFIDGGADTDLLKFTSTVQGVNVNLASGFASGFETGFDTIEGIENVTGGAGGDSITGDDNSNVLDGEGGNDFLSGGFGDDSLNGGDGNDQLQGGAGNDGLDGGAGEDFAVYLDVSGGAVVDLAAGTGEGGSIDTLTNIEHVIGSFGDDSLTGNDGANSLLGGNGNDVINGAGGDDSLTGGNDNDVLNGGDGNDDLEGGFGNDALNGGAGVDTASFLSGGGVVVDLGAGTANGQGIDTLSSVENLNGSNSNDILFGNGADNRISGQGGDDLIQGGGGDDLLDGGFNFGGGDTVDFSGAGGAVNVNLALGTATGEGTDQLLNFENVLGSSNNDIIRGGTGGSGSLSGNNGNDSLIGQGSSDRLFGGADDDVLVQNFASNGNFLEGGTGDDTVTGNAGTDTLLGGAGDLGNDTYDGQGGIDTLVFDIDGPAVNVDLNVGAAIGQGNDVIQNVENVVGTDLGDLIGGTNGVSHSFTGLVGNDTLNGLDGNDVLDGGDDDDALDGGIGGDFLFGGAGNDNLSGNADADLLDNGDDVLDGGTGDDFLDGDDGNDSLIGGAGTDDLDGGSGTDTADYTSEGAVTVDIGAGTATVGVVVDTLTSIEIVLGGGGADDMLGDGVDNTFFGNAGNDDLDGAGGNDLLDGGSENDTVDGVGGDDSLFGGFGSDTLIGGLGDDLINGNDQFFGFDFGGTADTVDYSSSPGAPLIIDLGAGTATGDGNDTLISIENAVGGGGGDTITGTTGNNSLSGGGGIDSIFGGFGDDVLNGGPDNDFLFGEAGNDTLAGGTGNDTTMDGGAEFDMADYTAQGGPVDVDLNTGVGNHGGGTDSLTDIEGVIGAGAADILTGNGVANSLVGNAGDDTMNGLGGNDVLFGGADDDILDGGDNDDSLEGGADNDQLLGGNGNDNLKGGAGDDLLTGGANTDTADFSDGAGNIVVDLTVGGPQVIAGLGTDTLSGIENVTGGTGNDTITGDGGANSLFGSNGNDLLIGGGGNDILNGGFDTNTFRGGAGDDTFFSNNGLDTVDFSGVASGVTVNLGAGTATGEGNDTLSFVENVQGGAGADTIIGAAGNNALLGGGGADVISSGDSFFFEFNLLDGEGGNDTLTGGISVDQLEGGANNDLLHGGDNNDILRGEDGNDSLFGDAGNDSFIGEAGNDFIDGGDGFDTLDYSGGATAGITGTISVGSITSPDFGTDSIVNIELFLATNFADSVTGSAGNDSILGLNGADSLNGADGNDTLNDGSFDGANDILRGGDGDDNLVSSGGNDSLFGDAGNDVLNDGPGDDLLNGGDGRDRVLFNTGLDIVANLGQGTAVSDDGADTLVGIEDLVGGNGNDTFTGDAGANFLSGGNFGADVLNGGGGDDVLRGGFGDDALNGGTGLDVADFSDAFQRVIVDLADVTQSRTGNLGTDTFSSIEGVFGGSNRDVLTGTDGDNILRGNGQVDVLTGGGGVDRFQYVGLNDGVQVGTDEPRATVGAAGVFGDFIFDFQTGVDKIVFDASVFGFDVGALDAADFRTIEGAYNGLNSGVAAGDPTLIFSIEDRTLYYDADTGQAGYSVIADVLDGTIKASDIEIAQLT